MSETDANTILQSPYKYRPLARCLSPPIWACYETDNGSECSGSESEANDDESCSEDDEDYRAQPNEPQSDDAAKDSHPVSNDQEASNENSRVATDPAHIPLPPSPPPSIIAPAGELDESDDMEIDVTEPKVTIDIIQPLLNLPEASSSEPRSDSGVAEAPPTEIGPSSDSDRSPTLKGTSEVDPDTQMKDVDDRAPESEDDNCCEMTPEQKRQRALDKGKGRVQVEVVETPITPPPEPVASPVTPVETTEPAPRSPTPTPTPAPPPPKTRYRPILAIRQSQGWIWNQELFVPQYMKDRCIPVFPELPGLNIVMGDQPIGRDYEMDSYGIHLTPEDTTRILPVAKDQVA